MNEMILRVQFGYENRIRVVVRFAIALILVTVHVNALTIIPTFDSSITDDSNASKIQATIYQALQVYEASFSDQISVTIKFIKYTNGFANSGWAYVYIPYSSYVAALKSHAVSPYDVTAISHIPDGPTNPVNGSQTMNVQFPNARALGFNVNPGPGQTDGEVYLNTSQMNLDRHSIDPSKWDLMSVAMHEIDEVLGFASALNGLTNGAAVPTGGIWPMDLFRYSQSQNGTRSFDTSLSTQAYFSIDGTNRLVRFSQAGGLDFSDWFGWVVGVIPQVQDSATATGATADLGIEKIALDVIGFTLVESTLAPVITSETKGRTNFNLIWTTIPALPYQVQYSTNVFSTNWVNLGNTVVATNTTASISDSVGSASQRFYRVGLRQ